ncbi:MAG: ORF6N domain-containing protein [Paludibacteraceae bacterium]|nr:ORF6N domain-containing protein [Paludibacteraceae bacterium]
MSDLVLIQKQIYTVNGERVMFDDDLAKLYGVETAQLKRAVKRNIERFPSDFMFVVKNADLKNLKSQLGNIKREVVDMTLSADKLNQRSGCESRITI